MKVSDFLNTQLVDYASYSTVRMLGSAIDGQKNASRKVLRLILDKNIKTEKKVSQLGQQASEYSEYLHGSIDGSIVTMAQNYIGTNNLPLLDRGGNFGTRFSPEASASRYISTNGSKALFELFNKDDESILEHQEFEGTQIEPKFYLPNLPIMLINGSDGIATGFAQKILSRNPRTIKTAIKNKLNGKKYNKNTFVPYFEGFKGTVTKGEKNNQWIIKGIVNKKSITKVEITELPVGYSLKSYIKVLDKLEDDKVITKYKDKSDNGEFFFEVSFLSTVLKNLTNEQLLSKLKLIKTVSENYTCINEHNKVEVFNSAEEIFNYYYDVKLRYLQKRKDSLVTSLELDIRLDFSRYLFIKSIVEDELKINKRKKKDIEEDLNNIDNIIKNNGSFDYLLNMNIMSLTEERMKKLQDDIKIMKEKLNNISNITLEQMWDNEL